MKGHLASIGRVIWAALNSAVFIAVLGALVLAALTNWYAIRQADDSDRQARRAELTKLIVELDLRVARLKVASDQASAAAKGLSQALATAGSRGIAIVDGDPRTVTSNPEFRNEHLVSLLSRAEFVAGLKPADKEDLLTFTDLDHCSAARQLGYVYARVHPLEYFLQKSLSEGSLPQALGSDETAFQSEVYANIAAQTEASAKPLNILVGGGRSLRDFSVLCR